MDDLIDGIWRLLMHDDTGPSQAVDEAGRDAARRGARCHDIHLPGQHRQSVEFTVAQLAELVLEFPAARARSVPARCPWTIRRSASRISRARALLGFEPKVPLEEGLQQTIPYFREQVQRGSE